jgi:hypothetical protein
MRLSGSGVPFLFRHTRADALMTDAELEGFLPRIALTPVRLSFYVKHLSARRTATQQELRRAERPRAAPAEPRHSLLIQ